MQRKFVPIASSSVCKGRTLLSSLAWASISPAVAGRRVMFEVRFWGCCSCYLQCAWLRRLLAIRALDISRRPQLCSSVPPIECRIPNRETLGTCTASSPR